VEGLTELLDSQTVAISYIVKCYTGDCWVVIGLGVFCIFVALTTSEIARGGTPGAEKHWYPATVKFRVTVFGLGLVMIFLGVSGLMHW